MSLFEWVSSTIVGCVGGILIGIGGLWAEMTISEWRFKRHLEKMRRKPNG